MSLYVCVLTAEDRELDGFQVGAYTDFGRFLRAVRRQVSPADCPSLMKRYTADEHWTVAELPALIAELEKLAVIFRARPPARTLPSDYGLAAYVQDWVVSSTNRYRFSRTASKSEIAGRSLYECFLDVDGENLFEALIRLARTALRTGRPISFK